MPLGLSEEEYMALEETARDAGLRIEIAGGLPIWELAPSPMHQMDLMEILRTIRGAHAVPDVTIRFSDGSYRRPDISVFCTRPPRIHIAATEIPIAVVELLSSSSIVKDTELSPSWYLSQGVKDVFVYDPEGLTVDHYRASGRERHKVPTELETETGCLVGFPQPPED